MIKLLDVLRPTHVIMHMESRDIESAIQELAAHLSQAPEVRNIQAFTQEVIARERAAPTVLGNGLALPHARTANVSNLCLAAGISRDGFMVGCEKVHFVILAGVPHAMAAEYLRILGCLARVFTTTGSATVLMQSADPAEFIRQLDKFSKKL